MVEGVVRQQVCFFKNGRTNIFNDERHDGKPTVVSNEFMEKIYEKFHESSQFIISEPSEQYLQISRIVL